MEETQNLLILLDKQGLFKGDLNVVQQLGLVWITGHNIEEQIEFERYRTLNNALATNPGTSGDFIKELLKEEQPEPIPSEWVTPRSIQEIEEVLKGLI